MSVITGRLDGPRFERIRRNIIEHVRYRKTRIVIIDLSAVIGGGDVEVGKQLVKTVRMVELIGAKCMLVGIDSVIAQALENVVPDVQSLNTFSSFEAGIEKSLALLGYEIVKKPDGGNLG